MKTSKVDCKIKSTKRCKVCGKPLKKNLVDRRPKAEYCWLHYPMSKKNRPNANPIKTRKPIEVMR